MGFIKKLQQGNDLLSFWPVGSIYLSVNSTNPANYFGGTWTQIKDKFLLAAGDAYAAGATGGSATKNFQHYHTTQGHTLTVSEMPSHNHAENDMLATWYAEAGGGEIGDLWQVAGTKCFALVRMKARNTGNKGGGASHSHGNTGNALSTAQDIMPPYLAVYMWKRIA